MTEHVQVYGTCVVCGKQRTASLRTGKIGKHNGVYTRTPCPGRKVTRLDIHLPVFLPEWFTDAQRREYRAKAAQSLTQAARDLIQ